MNIGYTTDLSKPYAASLSSAKTFKELCSHVQMWEMLAGDAFDAVHAREFSWKEYRAGLAKERKDIYAGDEWAKKYGAIVMPEILMRISLAAMHYLVPDGCVFIRMRDFGQIQVKAGRAQWIEAAPAKKGTPNEQAAPQPDPQVLAQTVKQVIEDWLDQDLPVNIEKELERIIREWQGGGK